ncbi:hypothetical protein BJX70DRAFT_23679 [Aspergillus crustosus]
MREKGSRWLTVGGRSACLQASFLHTLPSSFVCLFFSSSLLRESLASASYQDSLYLTDQPNALLSHGVKYHSPEGVTHHAC